jgi:hypothetical protein
MSSFSEVGVIFAIAVSCVYLYVWIDRFIKDQADAIITGVVRGVPLPTKSRELLVYTSWFNTLGVGICWEVLQVILWITIGQVANAEEARLVAYLCAFLASGGTVAWIYEGAMLYPHLRSLLRQADAD